MTNIKPNIMFVFPGQGTQYVGMGTDLCKKYRVAKRVYNTANKILEYDLRQLCSEGPEEKLNKTEFTQPAILTHSIACLEVFKELTNGKYEPQVLAGHSLGEYTALVAAKSFSFQKALKLVSERGKLMDKYGEGNLTAFIIDPKKIEPIVKDFDCYMSVYNLPDQAVVGGKKQDLKKLEDFVAAEFKNDIRRIIPLKVGAASHTKLMDSAAEKFKPYLAEIRMRLPKYYVLSNYTGAYHPADIKKIKENLIYQLNNPVKWMQTAKKSFEEGINMVIEFGGGIGRSSGIDEKNPTLVPMAKKKFLQFGRNGIALPAINNKTIEQTVYDLNAFENIKTECNSDKKQVSQGGNMIVSNSYFLILPVKHGMITQKGADMINRINSMQISDKAIQLVEMPYEDEKENDVQGLAKEFGYKINKDEPILLQTNACDMASLTCYTGSELKHTLQEVKERTDFPMKKNN